MLASDILRSAPLVVSSILDRTKSWNYVFDFAILVSVVGGVAFACFSTDRNVFHQGRGQDDEEREVETEVPLLDDPAPL